MNTEVGFTMFDAHNHIQFPAYDADRDAVILRARGAGVRMIASGTQVETSAAAVALAEKYPDDVWATAGFHPNHATEAGWYHDKNEQRGHAPEVFDAKKLKAIASHPKVVAVGECGLDYFRLQENNESPARHASQLAGVAGGRIKERQRDVFLQQIEIAKELKKPLVIHARPSKGTDDAYEDVLAILQTTNYKLPTIFHFYAGTLPMTKKLVDAGASFTFGGVTTFSHDYDDVIRYIPLDRIMLETDAPYVAPAPHRSKRNEPAYVVEVAKKIAELKGVPYEEVVAVTTANALKIFGIEA